MNDYDKPLARAAVENQSGVDCTKMHQHYQGAGKEGSHLVPLLVVAARRVESKHRSDMIDLGWSLIIGWWMEPACFNF